MATAGTDAGPELGKKKVGAVAVIGGGIGGMQTALSLANAGFKVYLIETLPAIGGVMAELDKTFPTNDCAMCTISPRLVECGRHLNIEIMTMAEVEDVTGEAGNFTVRVRQRPRFIDIEKCSACGDCATACPISRPDDFNKGLATRRAAHKLYPQAIPSAFAIEKRGTAPCRGACPIHQRAEGYIALVHAGRYDEAYQTILEDNPFPGICGRICNHRCEDDCSRRKVDEPVSIMRLKRFVADWASEHGLAPAARAAPKLAKPGKVAVVGAGPAGLTCALALVRLGHRATVFEALPVAGGMMRVGVPAYRLPHDGVQREIDAIVAQGVELRLNSRVTDLEALFNDGYQAVFLAPGAHKGRKLRIPGADLPEVLVNTDFLRSAALGEPPDLGGKRVFVVGGGNVAMDCARTAVRLGAAHVLASCLESCEKMPAHPWEVDDARQEGVEVINARTFLEITSAGGHVTGVRCAEVDFRGFLPDGRPDMDILPGTEAVIPADVVIFATGTAPETEFAASSGLELRRNGTVVVDPATLQTSRRGVFSGGDAITGTAFIVDAIAAGHKAARSIDRFLQGDAGAREPVLQPVVEITDADLSVMRRAGAVVDWTRASQRQLPPAERLRSFAEVDLPLTEEEARAEAERCLQCGICSECLACSRVCKAGAVDHEMAERTVELKVGTVVLASGFETFEASPRAEFGYGLFPNVVTSLQFERILSSSGPFGGVVQRPFDGKHPKRIAWLQCVGSRDEPMGRSYCSAVCCTYATKEAIITKEHAPGTDTHIFFIDMRTYGKGFEEYRIRAEKEHGVVYHRCRVPHVDEDPETKDLILTYRDDAGKTRRERFDLVVLSVGMQTPDTLKSLMKRLGVEANESGFAATPPLEPVTTSREGIFVAGALQSPKDIPDTVAQGLGAAALASEAISSERGTLATVESFPPEKDVDAEEPRIGVFVCHCGSNIAGVVDVKELADFIRKRKDLGVVFADSNLYTCSSDTQKKMKDTIKELGLNRVVVASCTPRTHEPLFQNTLKEAGINQHLFELASIREHVSWVHRADPRRATEKAKHMLLMAVEKVRRAESVHKEPAPVTHAALIIGGGIAGMTAAAELAAQGFESHLVEQEAQFGGNARNIFHLLSGEDPQKFLGNLIARVKSDPRIHVHLSSTVKDVEGFIGNFKARIESTGSGQRAGGKGQATGNGQQGKTVPAAPSLLTGPSPLPVDPSPLPVIVEVGAIIVATGARELAPVGYFGFGTDSRIITQLQLDRILHEGKFDSKTVVMIQCVGSREDTGRTYCSRVCCSEAVKNAIETKKDHPKTDVYVLYRDMRTYGLNEKHYLRARELGVQFIRYENTDKPVASVENGRLKVEVNDHDLAARFVIRPDLLVLSAATLPPETNLELAQILKVPQTEHGFFMEAHAKIAPLSFTAEGIYMCGTAHSPRFMDETIAQALGAAQKAMEVLSKEKVSLEGIPVHIDADRCTGCGYCEAVCPTKAIKINKKTGKAEVTEVLCKGCGACAVACPSGVPSPRGFTKDQITTMVDAALEEL